MLVVVVAVAGLVGLVVGLLAANAGFVLRRHCRLGVRGLGIGGGRRHHGLNAIARRGVLVFRIASRLRGRWQQCWRCGRVIVDACVRIHAAPWLPGAVVSVVVVAAGAADSVAASRRTPAITPGGDAGWAARLRQRRYPRGTGIPGRTSAAEGDGFGAAGSVGGVEQLGAASAGRVGQLRGAAQHRSGQVDPRFATDATWSGGHAAFPMPDYLIRSLVLTLSLTYPIGLEGLVGWDSIRCRPNPSYPEYPTNPRHPANPQYPAYPVDAQLPAPT